MWHGGAREPAPPLGPILPSQEHRLAADQADVTITAPIKIVLLVVAALALAASAFVLIEQGSNKAATNST